MAFLEFGHESAQPRVTVVTTMKDEGAYILDWVAHYKTLGATDIVVFTNDCSDPTDLVLRNLNRMGQVHHRFNKVKRRGPHKSALMWGEHEPSVANADWILVVDVDEYLQINVGDGTFKALIDAHPDADAISLVWRVFGSAGIREISDTPVPMEFTLAQRAAAGPDDAPHRFFKTLYRNTEKFARMGVHRPFLHPEAEGIKWVVPGGVELPSSTHAGALHVRGEFGYDVAQLNHYALRSRDSFLNKQKRGRANHFKGTLKKSYWDKFDQNHVEDRTLADSFDVAVEYKQELLLDAALRKHHEASFDWARRSAEQARKKRAGRWFVAGLEKQREEEMAALQDVQVA